MLFRYPEFTLAYKAHVHTWELTFVHDEEIAASTLMRVFDIIEHHNLDAPLLLFRQEDASVSFTALRLFERRAPLLLPAMACISSSMATRRALEITFCILIQDPVCRVFSNEHDARAWLARVHSPYIQVPLSLLPGSPVA